MTLEGIRVKLPKTLRTFAAGVPFRDTHHLSGAAVKMAEERGCSLFDLMPEDLRTIHPLFADDVAEVLRASPIHHLLGDLPGELCASIIYGYCGQLIKCSAVTLSLVMERHATDALPATQGQCVWEAITSLLANNMHLLLLCVALWVLLLCARSL